jgi:NADPH2:quinone reductase
VDGYPSGAARAHALMESNTHVGKIVITWGAA